VKKLPLEPKLCNFLYQSLLVLTSLRISSVRQRLTFASSSELLVLTRTSRPLGGWTGFRLASNSAYIYYAYILSITSLDISWARFEAPRKTSCHLPGVFVEYSIYHLARKSPRFGYIVINVQQPPFNLIHTYLGQFYIVAPWIRGWLELHCGGQGPRLAYGNLRSCGYHPYATWDSGCLLCSRASPCHWSPYRRDHSCRTSWSGIACIQ